jgi:hydroxyacylglutathione hydrolase
MAKMIEIAEGVRFIPGEDEFIPDSHVYLVGNPSSRDLSLIDAGLVGKGNGKIQSILKGDIDLKDIKRVIMTHTHLDHIGGLAQIRQQMPWAELWVHALEAEALEGGDERTVYGMDMFRGMCQNQYGLQPGAFTFPVNRKLQGDETLEIGGMGWETIHIPGHSMGSIALYHREKQILIPGDVIYADYAIGRFDLHGADPSELKKSLLKLSELEVNVLLPGHNQVLQKVPRGYLLKTARQWEAYLT